MVGLGVSHVLVDIVVTQNDILEGTVLVGNEQVGDTGTVWDERSIDALRGQSVLLEWVAGEWWEGSAGVSTIAAISAIARLSRNNTRSCDEQRAGERHHFDDDCC